MALPNFKPFAPKFKAEMLNIPRKVGIVWQAFTLDNFKKEGFQDSGLQSWQKRKRTEAGARRNLLVKSGNLRRSWKFRAIPYQVFLATPIPYAKTHNEGTRSGRGKGFQMPKRQMVGKSKALEAEIKKVIGKQIKAIFQ